MYIYLSNVGRQLSPQRARCPNSGITQPKKAACEDPKRSLNRLSRATSADGRASTGRYLTSTQDEQDLG